MAVFVVRVVLHGADSYDYNDLHDAMIDQAGAKRTITSSEGVVYDLPDGEYYISSSKTRSDVYKQVLQIAKNVKENPSILVTESAGITFKLKKVPGDS